MLPWGRMLLPGIAGFQPAPVRSDALIAWRTSGTVQTPSWDRGFQPAPVGSEALIAWRSAILNLSKL